jgi:hypothetical protein
MTSYRRQSVEIDAIMEDFADKTPEDLRAALALLDKIVKIGIAGYTAATVTVRGRPEELADLADELNTWTPSGGWSPEATKLFKALRGEDV